MGGHRISKRTEDFLCYIYDNLWKSTGKKPSAKDVLNAAEANIKAQNRKDIFLPRIRKTQYILDKRRPEDREPLDKQELIMRSRWSMAKLNDYPLPPESIPYVLQVWRYACHVHEEFTVRQAKWVSRLYKFKHDITMLWVYSYEYALKEERHVKYQTDFETFFDDASLIMPDIELQTLFEIKHENEPAQDAYNTGMPVNKDYLPVEEVLHPFAYYKAVYSGMISNERDGELLDLMVNVDAIKSLKLNTEMFMIYLRWFTHIRETSDWQKINTKQALDVINKLRDWIRGINSLRQVNPYSGDVNIEVVKEGLKMSFDAELSKPDQALKLLSKYATEGGIK